MRNNYDKWKQSKTMLNDSLIKENIKEQIKTPDN